MLHHSKRALFKSSASIYILLGSVAILHLLPASFPIAASENLIQGPTRNSTASDKKQAELSEILLPVGAKCQEVSSCKTRGRRRDLDVGPDKSNCYCDKKCALYDDCCLDSTWTEPINKRLELGSEKLAERRSQWHCRRINNIFGDIVLRASCKPDWMNQQDDLSMANLIKRRCEYVKDRGKNSGRNNRNNLDGDDDDSHAAQSDPIGMMMPITDLSSGITYANSYCLRCNTLATTANGDASSATPAAKRMKLIYWSPLLECNYNLESDERNTLYDLISSKKGQALQYSSKKNKWIIVAGNNNNKPAINQQSNKTTSGADEQRVCSIMPTIPDSVEHMIRYCKANLIRTCPNSGNATAASDLSEQQRRARLECEFGHQSITYSLVGRAVYYNPACAICNGEQRIFCEPKSSRTFTAGPVSKIVVLDKAPPSSVAGGRPVFAPPSEGDMIEATTTTAGFGPDAAGEGFSEDGELTNSAARANSHESSTSGSFSVLMDLYGSSQDEASSELFFANLSAADPSSIAAGGGSVVGATAAGQQQHNQQQQQNQHQLQQQQQCPDPLTQVFDPFYLTCRDVVCGLNHKFVDGKCVDKFKPAMVYITDVCLIVSITSLALYLILYALSTFDLRPMALELAHWRESLEAAEAAAEAAAAAAEAEAAARDESQVEASESQQQQQDQRKSSSESRLRKLHGFAAHKRHSRVSNEGSTASGPPSSIIGGGARHSQSLSTRGVASLAGSLLAAYLFFMLGHQTETGIQVRRQPLCAGLAAATYYCFLVAFCWMFLLSYDIWRTLRLATCQLRGPAMHSQSGRFLSYALLALLLSALLVGLAVLVDQLPLNSVSCGYADPSSHLAAATAQHMSSAKSSNCSSSGYLWWNHFVQVYKPNFGHQPGSCWFSNRRALALFFGLPVTLIMVANLMFFLHSSCMVIRTSSRSSRQLSKSASTQMPAAKSFVSLEKGLSQNNNNNSNNLTDFTLQNSLTMSSIVSVQTLQSHLSASSSISNNGDEPEPGAANLDSSQVAPPPPLDGAKEPALPMPKHAKLDSSLSSNSLATNHSGTSAASSSTSGSSHSSIASSILALKYDSHLQSLQSMMGSIIKDYRLYCRLSTIMGLTWLTGLLASLVDQSEALWYLFVVLNTLQGLFIFIAFGCKRSKLSNLELLFDYLKFRLANRKFCRPSSCSSSSSPPTKPKVVADRSSRWRRQQQQHLRQDSLSSQSSGAG